MNGIAKSQQQQPKQQQQQQQQRPQRMGGEQQQRSRGYIPAPANISANENEYCVELEMPGVDKQGLEVTVEQNQLEITGRRKQELPEGELVYSETPLLADYRRVFELGSDVDPEKVRAEMDQGVLKLHLPRRENAKRRKIEVSG